MFCVVHRCGNSRVRGNVATQQAIASRVRRGNLQRRGGVAWQWIVTDTARWLITSCARALDLACAGVCMRPNGHRPFLQGKKRRRSTDGRIDILHYPPDTANNKGVSTWTSDERTMNMSPLSTRTSNR